MARRRKSASETPENQLSLFDLLVDGRAALCATEPAPGSFNMTAEIRHSISEAIRKSGLKRWEIAGRMSELLGAEVTESMLNAWSAESREDRRFPAEYLAAFCHVTGDLTLLHRIASRLNCHVFETEQAVLAELGRIRWQREQLAERERAVRRYLERLHEAIAESDRRHHREPAD